MNDVWCILRPNIVNSQVSDLGIAGTGFFISPREFVSSYHCLNEASFVPDERYNNDHVILKSPSGDEIHVAPQMVSYYPDMDVSKVMVSRDYSYLDLALNTGIGDPVSNLGYPSGAIGRFISIQSRSPFRFSVSLPDRQAGHILSHSDDFSFNSNDVNIVGKQVIITDYSSIVGFSGGPLLNKNAEVIGMMSMVIPSGNGDLANKTVAISIAELIKGS